MKNIFQQKHQQETVMHMMPLQKILSMCFDISLDVVFVCFGVALVVWRYDACRECKRLLVCIPIITQKFILYILK